MCVGSIWREYATCVQCKFWESCAYHFGDTK
nr:MAG TPA: hypothetical protein [Caudoviricetes sp.]